MRFLLNRTDALGDLVISLPVRERILSRMPEARIHWLVRPQSAPLLEGLGEIHLREPGADLPALFRGLALDAVLNLSHRDPAVISAAREAGVPVRVARSRGRQIWEATHVLWRGRYGSGRHEAQNALDFLKPFGWDGGAPPLPRLTVTPAEALAGRASLEPLAHGRRTLGVVLRGSGAGAFPSQAWWDRALPLIESWGWSPVILSPPENSPLDPAGLRDLMGRLSACDAVLGPSTGPVHMAAALGVPVVCLMGLRTHHGPDRWAPLGAQVQVVLYPGPEADLKGGMDRLDPAALLPHLNRLKGAS